MSARCILLLAMVAGGCSGRSLGQASSASGAFGASASSGARAGSSAGAGSGSSASGLPGPSSTGIGDGAPPDASAEATGGASGASDPRCPMTQPSVGAPCADAGSFSCAYPQIGPSGIGSTAGDAYTCSGGQWASTYPCPADLNGPCGPTIPYPSAGCTYVRTGCAGNPSGTAWCQNGHWAHYESPNCFPICISTCPGNQPAGSTLCASFCAGLVCEYDASAGLLPSCVICDQSVTEWRAEPCGVADGGTPD